MGIKFGEIDASQILENEYRILTLEKIIDKIIQQNPNAILTQKEIDNIREEVVNVLKQKYPNSGISLQKK